MPTHKTENLQKAIHWTRLVAYENQDTITILTFPDKEWTTNDTPYMTKFDDTHVSIYFVPDTITYIKPTILPKLKKEPHIEILAIRILCIHHKNTGIDIWDLKTILLQIIISLQISLPYIIPPSPIPTNTKVYKHPQWSKSSYFTYPN